MKPVRRISRFLLSVFLHDLQWFQSDPTARTPSLQTRRGRQTPSCGNVLMEAKTVLFSWEVSLSVHSRGRAAGSRRRPPGPSRNEGSREILGRWVRERRCVGWSQVMSSARSLRSGQLVLRAPSVGCSPPIPGPTQRREAA